MSKREKARYLRSCNHPTAYTVGQRVAVLQILAPAREAVVEAVGFPARGGDILVRHDDGEGRFVFKNRIRPLTTNDEPTCPACGVQVAEGVEH